VSKQFAEEVLRSHNEYRRSHQAPPLKLSSKLSREAARYAESLASTRILKHSVESSRGSCGENLAWASYDQPGKDVADRWYDEVKQYSFNNPGFSSGTGKSLLHGSLSLTRLSLSLCLCLLLVVLKLPNMPVLYPPSPQHGPHVYTDPGNIPA
uniref:Golgi-associated plant pathogenesis-related protein 1 n=1 Tax=Gadus morhua TaxID=8049 RepID=A0A8C4ZNI1_GADMO